jgi:hypothetical protein
MASFWHRVSTDSNSTVGSDAGVYISKISTNHNVVKEEKDESSRSASTTNSSNIVALIPELLAKGQITVEEARAALARRSQAVSQNRSSICENVPTQMVPELHQIPEQRSSEDLTDVD